jgi:hypothetical protein
MAKDGISFAGNPDLIEWLEGRGDRSRTQESAGMRAKTELGLWRAVLKVELQRQHWTLAEMGLLADVHNGAMIYDGVGIHTGMIAMGVIDSLHEYPGSYGEKHEVDEDTIKKKVLDLGPAADNALVDAIARWWATNADHTPEGWASVGIYVRDETLGVGGPVASARFPQQ